VAIGHHGVEIWAAAFISRSNFLADSVVTAAYRFGERAASSSFLTNPQRQAAATRTGQIL
jgi:hypothetical protein